MSMAIETARRRLEAQGYCDLDDPALRELGPWLRWSPALCTTVIIVGTVLGSPAVLLGLAPLAALGAMLNRHPFDHIYNAVVRRVTKTRPLPPHAAQRRFACGLAALWLTGTAWAFHIGATQLGYVLGGALAAVALLVSVTHFCIPSLIYNTLFGRKAKGVAT
jgi:hypothetical protein